MKTVNVDSLNKEYRDKSPKEIISYGLKIAKSPIVTTNFRPYESVILSAITEINKSIKVVWCDTGYNTSNTYRHAEELTELLGLNIQLYVPKQTAAHRDITLGVPSIDDPKHKIFTEQVKLEPFKRAMLANQPDVWFTNLRKGQTSFRNDLDIFSQDAKGILKISPFYYWSDEELDHYLVKNNLPNELNYFDPTKQLANRECGLHT